jgi:16S rRNA (guanine966-N2)-methyltransferase
MKVTGGMSKGRLLASIKGLDIRPTSGKVREAIFNLLGQDMTGLKVLDLFAGTGGLGIEALSRGALSALFIDNSYLSIKTIKKNLRACGFEDSGIVLQRDIMRGQPFKHRFFQKGTDIVFIDPPYRRDYIPPVLKRLSDAEILATSAIVVTESLKDDNLPDRAGKLRLFDTRIYGETKIDMYSREDL